MRILTYENRVLAILSLGGGVAALDAQALFYLAPFVVRDLSLSNGQVGMLSSAVLVTWSIAAYGVGAFSDRLGRRKPFLVAAFALFAVCSVLSGLAATYVTLFAARLLIGLAEGPVIPMSNPIMVAESSPSRRGFNVGVVQNFGSQLIGSLLGPIMVVAVATTFDWHTAFFLAGLPGLAIAGLVAAFIREPAACSGEAAQERTGGGFASLLAYRNVLLCSLVACCLVGWFVLLLTFLPLYCVTLRHLTPATMSLVMAAIGAAGVVSAVIVPALSDRVGRRPVMILFCFSGVIAPLGALFAGDGVVAMMVLIFVGCQGLGTFPLYMGTIPLETVRPVQAARATALVMGIGQCVGGFAGPALAGYAADAFGLTAPLWIAVGCALAAGTLCLFLQETAPRRRRPADVASVKSGEVGDVA